MNRIIFTLEVPYDYEQFKKRKDKVLYIRGLIRDAVRYDRRKHNDSKSHMGFYVIGLNIREEVLVLRIRLRRIGSEKLYYITYTAEDIVKRIEEESK